MTESTCMNDKQPSAVRYMN